MDSCDRSDQRVQPKKMLPLSKILKRFLSRIRIKQNYNLVVTPEMLIAGVKISVSERGLRYLQSPVAR